MTRFRLKRIPLFFLITMLSLLLEARSYANWTGYSVIVSGPWGSSPGQFDFFAGDSFDYFPKEFGVDITGGIYIRDEANKRVQIFKNNGILEKIISPPSDLKIEEEWPFRIFVHPNGGFVASYDGPKKFFYDDNGDLNKRADAYGDAVPTENAYILSESKTKYYKYSPTGELLKTYSERPLELGQIKTKRTGTTQYKTTVTYPDKTWTIIEDGSLADFVRDTKGNLYGFRGKGVVRFNDAGEEIASLTIPKSEFKAIETPPGRPSNVDVPLQVVVEYGSPVVGPNGDVYTWKRTPDKYSIIKWAWQE